MTRENPHAKGWVYVFVTGKEGNETFLGLYYKEKDVHFIPTFTSKEAAQDCYLNLPREKGVRYEVQAVHVEELQISAAQNGFTVAMVDAAGELTGETLS